jgi:hypothetical protein
MGALTSLGMVRGTRNGGAALGVSLLILIADTIAGQHPIDVRRGAIKCSSNGNVLTAE